MKEITIFSWALAGIVIIYIFISNHNKRKKEDE